MAEKPDTDVVDEYADDPDGRRLADSIRANEALLQGLKYDLGQRIVQAQEGDGEYPAASELAQMKKLETQLESDRMFLQARNMTRRP